MEAPDSGSGPTAKRRQFVPPTPPSALEVASASGPYMPPLCTKSRNPSAKCYGDRFIPDRSAMDMDMAYFFLTEPTKEKENTDMLAPAEEAYKRVLAEKLLNNRSWILTFRNKAPEPEGMVQQLLSETLTSSQTKPARKRRHIPQSSERTLDAPGIVDDFYLNILDWGSNNVVSIALGNTMYLWNSSVGSITDLVTIDEDGQRIAVGMNSSDIHLWDTSSNRMLRTLPGVHQSRVGSLAWNKDIQITGGMDGNIVNNDVRMRSHIVQIYQGHEDEICGLRWSGSCQQLASGGNDNLVHIWDVSMASSNPSLGHNRWLHRFGDHLAAVKALAWCPFQSNLLASGGGGNDRCIKFWNTHTGMFEFC